jgi:hypothetical protein
MKICILDEIVELWLLLGMLRVVLTGIPKPFNKCTNCETSQRSRHFFKVVF